MRKIIVLISCLFLSACAQVMAANEESITIDAPPIARAEAFQKAQEHCAKFDKDAVPSGTVFGTSTVFECK